MTSEDKFRKFIKYVSDSLQTNGLFVGTCMNGNQIIQLLNSREQYENSAFLIQRKRSEISLPFGDKVNVHLIGTLYFGENTISKECLVYNEVLVQICKEYSLELVELRSFQSYHTENFGMDNDHKMCSFLYQTFCFKESYLNKYTH